ncbi:hypothetical protein TRFO_21075 [Tritrichomonas foetus]|uniref:N-acetylgalactosaminide beta-1,3-galactosyltransferase n=1 Tax=Tritrichomonas foetus TaxID=1144522 RepID=A0A1J4KKD3_9EUKA|nr:hypothetical protein TRFO_21075 [Tritrichomonas foetus]|eukprot:OHT09813.1 hypothetical protein TRFO_21075 [Tritrichomonas foetus]
MILFTFCFALTSKDVSVGIWTGYECIFDRGVAAVKTWVRQFPCVHFFSDFFPKNAEEKLSSYAFPSTLKFISLGNCAKQIWFPTPWERAQPRFVKSMHTLYKLDSSKQWYIFADDDSYIFLNNTLEILSRFNSSNKVVVGHFYCAWPEVVFGRDHSQQCMNFPQGGAGVAISRGMMISLSDKLLECNEKYNHRHYAGSMRFGKCIHDHIKDGTWRHGNGLQNFKSQFNSRNPIEEIEDNMCHRSPATFHKLNPKALEFVYNGHRSEWPQKSSLQSKNYYVDWSHLTSKPFLIFLDERQPFHLRFGIAISTMKENRVLVKATSKILPIFSDFDTFHDKPIAYEQEFGESIKIHLDCDDVVDYFDVAFDSVENRDCIKINMRVKCPEPQQLGIFI